MFPTGLTEVMVTPLEPPRVGPLLAPDLVLGLALPEVLRLLDLPTCAPFSTPVAFDAPVSLEVPGAKHGAASPRVVGCGPVPVDYEGSSRLGPRTPITPRQRVGHAA